jgi:3-deoxy-D-manno-octulosonic acid kinase
VRESGPGERAQLAALAPLAAEFAAADPEQLPLAEGLLAHAGRGRLRRWSVAGQSICVRAYLRGGLFGSWWPRRRRSPGRLIEELALSAALDELGLPTPRALGGWAVRCAFGWELYLATVEVQGAADLAAVLSAPSIDAEPPRTRRVLARSLGAFLRRLHDGGLDHPDLQPRNVLLRWPIGAAELEPSAMPWWILDLDRASLRPRLAAERRAASLARLWRWWIKRPHELRRLRQSDTAAFWCGYAARHERRALCDSARQAFARRQWLHRLRWRFGAAAAT